MATWDIVRAFYEQVYQEQGLVVPHQALGVLKVGGWVCVWGGWASG